MRVIRFIEDREVASGGGEMWGKGWMTFDFDNGFKKKGMVHA